MTKIVFFDCEEITRNYLSQIKDCGCEMALVDRSIDQLNAAELRPYLDADIISVFVHSTNVNAKLLKPFARLKMVAVRSTGFDNVDLDYCRKRNIEVANVPRYGEITVAEYAFGLLLNLTRRITLASSDLKHNNVEITRYMGFDLAGKTIGIIGTGAIGGHAIGLAQGFGMKILAYDPYPNSKLGVKYTGMPELLSQSDVISLHCPLTKENRHLLDAKAFKAMKDGVIVINTARGELIDTQALCHALKSGKVAAAGLDVLEEEDFLLHDDVSLPGRAREYIVNSLYNLRLLQMKNVIITPHIGFDTIDAMHRILDATLENIKQFVRTGKSANSVLGKG
ncbi:MAG: hydroxyacid dehydrogenase [Alphaproteobacteria bacterium]|nr:hydroxyacid dehydrogenase [Alphaproteobacteria bacterium]